MSWKVERRRLNCGRGSTVSDVGDLTPVLVTRLWSEEVVAVACRLARCSSNYQAAMPQEETRVDRPSPIASTQPAQVWCREANCHSLPCRCCWRSAPLGAAGRHSRDAKWIALVCLHSGGFTRAQFCHYFDARRNRALRFVQTLIDRKAAVEGEWPLLNGGGKTCRISSNAIYRTLGVENIRHRRKASKPVVMRRLLSLDFVLEHPGMNWPPAEPEKVEFFEKLGLPRRIYYGVGGNQKRYFALKLPLAVDPEIVTFAYVNPGHATDTELHSWGAAHGPLWDALRKKGRQVRLAVGAD